MDLIKPRKKMFGVEISPVHFAQGSFCPACTILDFFLVCKLYRSGLLIMHYVLEVSRYTNVIYIGVYLVLT